MSLISAANMLAYADKLGNHYRLLKATAGVTPGNPVAGTLRQAIANLQVLAAGLNDYQQELDLVGSGNIATVLTKTPADVLDNFLQTLFNDLASHCSLRGSSVATSIQDINTFLSYYNGGAGAVKFSNPVTKDFADLYTNIFKTALAYPNVAFDPISSLWTPNPTSNGFGSKTVGGAFAGGGSINNTFYAEQPLNAVVTTNITGGTGTISATVTGVDDLGNAATWGPTVLTGGNNPNAAIAQQTVSSGGINAQARQTVTVASVTGIVAGSIVTINKSKPDQELVLVESVNAGANTFTGVFNLAHAASATVDGNTTTAMGAASTGAARQCRSISAITYTINGHSAGVVEIDGYCPRVSV